MFSGERCFILPFNMMFHVFHTRQAYVRISMKDNPNYPDPHDHHSRHLADESHLTESTNHLFRVFCAVQPRSPVFGNRILALNQTFSQNRKKYDGSPRKCTRKELEEKTTVKEKSRRLLRVSVIIAARMYDKERTRKAPHPGGFMTSASQTFLLLLSDLLPP